MSEPTPEEPTTEAAPEQPGAMPSSVTTVTENMKNAALPGTPVAAVVGAKAPAVWATKGWAADATDKPNVSFSGGASPGMHTLHNATLTADAEVVNLAKTKATWGTEGWT